MADHDDRAGAGAPPERRKTPTERYHELAMLAVNRAPQPPEHTLSLNLNAKGDVQIELTARGHDLGELVSSTTAAFDGLREKYPRTPAEPKASS